MSRVGIEHEVPGTILAAYQHWEMPNYAIYAGKEQRDCYEGGNMEEGALSLSDWLEMIKENGTTATYTLRVYPANETDITSKTVPKGSTTFCLNMSQPRTTRDGVTVIDNTRQIGATGNPSPAIYQQLLESNNRMIGAVTEMMTRAKEDKYDKIIELLMAERNAPKNDEPHWLEKLALVVCEKPEVIDKIGYIIRPNLYVHEQPINGTKTKEPVMAEAAAEIQPLTEAETEALNDRLYAALDTFTAKYGLVALVETMEAVAKLSDFKIKAMKAFL